MPYPSDQSIWAWTSSVSPAGARDATLWGFAYAAMTQTAPSTWKLADFQAFQSQVFAWIAPTHYWTSEFLLAYIQANGHFPSGPQDFTGWLTANGFAVAGSNGSAKMTGTYPTGGQGYPPGSGPTSGGAAMPVPSLAGATSASGILATVESAVKAHPFLAAGVAAGAVLLLGRR